MSQHTCTTCKDVLLLWQVIPASHASDRVIHVGFAQTLYLLPRGARDFTFQCQHSGRFPGLPHGTERWYPKYIRCLQYYCIDNSSMGVLYDSFTHSLSGVQTINTDVNMKRSKLLDFRRTGFMGNRQHCCPRKMKRAVKLRLTVTLKQP